ncbi:uncharacterized protein LOC100903013 [Galendromus occidentalis]|uniref:Uncharacterized protein LOC100903013 n=1 Tax=Galendromus occidentalis TaxID=34638 RepID=A0AAJ7L6B5_9ACAR|nr:uncharacterized protein LOC100903013 [Galendromus occidentalis]
MIAFVGLSCSLVGTVLGTFKTGREHLTIALLMIGVGIVLITVSGVAWRLTAYDSVSSCGTMLGLTTDPHAEPNRRFVNRMPPYGRYNHPYAAMMYPEFHYRPPPPTYQASMQEYRLRLLFDRHQNTTTTAAVGPVSPPPTYRSAQSTLEHSRPHLNQVIVEDYSRPPSYRSRASSSHGGPASMLRSCLGDVARSTDTLATTPPSESVPNPLASAVEMEKSPRESTGAPDNGTEKDTSARGSDVVKVYVNFAQE